MRAYLKNYRQSPRKIRLIGDQIRGKGVLYARTLLISMAKRGALPLGKLLDSAVANARNAMKYEEKDLFAKEIRIDKGITLKRYMPKSRGSAHPIHKRTSNVILVLGKK